MHLVQLMLARRLSASIAWMTEVQLTLGWEAVGEGSESV